MPRAGLTRARVVEAACELVDREGPRALTVSALAARLGIRPPSLYNHVDGLERLEREVALVGVDLLAEALREAAMGVAGREALAAVAGAYREVARTRPGVYALAQVARPGDYEYGRRAERVLQPVLAVLAGYGLEGVAAVHATRALRAALHGFALLETQGGFGLALDVEGSFRRLVEILDRGLAAG